MLYTGLNKNTGSNTVRMVKVEQSLVIVISIDDHRSLSKENVVIEMNNSIVSLPYKLILWLSESEWMHWIPGTDFVLTPDGELQQQCHLVNELTVSTKN